MNLVLEITFLLLRSDSSALCLPRSSCSPQSQIAKSVYRSSPRFISNISMQANILPVIVTNHTVTLAAELVIKAKPPKVSENCWPFLQNNGTRLVGQCAISHPVQSTPTISVTPFELPTNTMGELFTPQKNVAFESKEKDHFDLLESPVSRR